MGKQKVTDFDMYFATCDLDVVPHLEKIRREIRRWAPEANEKIAWGMPTFYFHENLVHFYAYKNHIGFYPGTSAIDAFKVAFEKAGYKWGKGSVQFPLSQPIPYDLIQKIVLFRVAEVNAKNKV